LQLQAFLLAPSFVSNLKPSFEAWIKKNASGIGFSREGPGGKRLSADELKEAKLQAQKRAYRATFSHIDYENWRQALTRKMMLEYECKACGHKPMNPKPTWQKFPRESDYESATQVANGAANTDAATSSQKKESAVQESAPALEAHKKPQDVKLTPAILYTTLLAADVKEEKEKVTPATVPRGNGGALDTTNLSHLLSLQKVDTLIGVVVKFVKDGALVDVKWDQERAGMVHISQIPKLPNQHFEKISDAVALNQRVTVRVTDVDEAWGRLSLSMKPAPPGQSRGGGGGRREPMENGSEGAPPPGTLCTGTVKAVKERIAFIDVGAKRDGVLDLPFPCLSRSERANGTDYLWWDVAKILRAHIGGKVRVIVDSLDEKPHLVFPPDVQCSGDP